MLTYGYQLTLWKVSDTDSSLQKVEQMTYKIIIVCKLYTTDQIMLFVSTYGPRLADHVMKAMGDKRTKLMLGEMYTMYTCR
jgi:hypothetical protein